MLVVAVFCIAIGLVSSQYDGNTCGERPLNPDGEKDFDKIVGGVESLEGDWPWSCSLRQNGGHICGGSLIASKWIVGAAHCVSATGASNPTVYTWACGIHSRTQSLSYTQIFTSIRIIRHPAYSGSNIRNDIALFELNQAAIYTDYVLPCCVPAAGATFPGETSVATGWGSTASGGGSAPTHREVSMPILTDARCEERFDGTNDMLDPSTQICAGEEGGNKDTCQGDSGGPLVAKRTHWLLIGLTSWGYGCGDGGVYTRVSAFRPWIVSYTGALPTGNL